MKSLLMFFAAGLLTLSAQAQVLRSATDRAAQLYWYEQALNERASKEARELGRILGLNESEMQLVRQFAAARLQAENEAQAFIVNDPVGRREAQERASAQFQTRLVNTLNESQMQRYFELLAETSSESVAAAPTILITDAVAPAIVAAAAPVAAPAPVVVADSDAVPAKPQIKKPSRRYAPIGSYHRRRHR